MGPLKTGIALIHDPSCRHGRDNTLRLSVNPRRSEVCQRHHGRKDQTRTAGNFHTPDVRSE